MEKTRQNKIKKGEIQKKDGKFMRKEKEEMKRETAILIQVIKLLYVEA